MIQGRAPPWELVLGDCALGGQVAQRQLQAWEEDQQQEEEEEEARRAEQLSDTLLQQEAKMMAEQGYRPKVGVCRGWATLLSHHSAWPLPFQACL